MEKLSRLELAVLMQELGKEGERPKYPSARLLQIQGLDVRFNWGPSVPLHLRLHGKATGPPHDEARQTESFKLHDGPTWKASAAKPQDCYPR